MEKFIEQIIKNLEANGFPQKKVSLPTEKMFEIADNKGFSFNKVLEALESDHQILGDIGDERIVFSKEVVQESNGNPFEGMDQGDMMAKAQEMMANMGPAELQRIQQMFMNMSDEEKADIMEQGKKMGLV